MSLIPDSWLQGFIIGDEHADARVGAEGTLDRVTRELRACREAIKCRLGLHEAARERHMEKHGLSPEIRYHPAGTCEVCDSLFSIEAGHVMADYPSLDSVIPEYTSSSLPSDTE